MGSVVSIADLRAQIRALEGGPRVEHARRDSGLELLDGLIGGLPAPGLLELCGPQGSGVVRMALELTAAETRRRRWVAWVDRERSFYPPAAIPFGVDLDRLLIVQPPAGGAEGGQHAGGWAVEQLLRCGCFRMVIVSSDPSMSEHRFSGTRWRQAAEKGGSTGVFLTRSPRASRKLQPDVRLLIDRGRMTVARDRSGRVGAIALLPSVDARVDPWL